MNIKWICSFIFSLLMMLFFPQNISEDSLLKKAKFEIYENPDESIDISNSLLKTEQNIDQQIELNLLISKAFISKRNYDESLKYILKASKLANQTNNIERKIAVLISIAIQYQQMELYNKSLETLDETDSLLSQDTGNVEKKHFQIARSTAIRGMIYKSQGNFEIALQKFLISKTNFEKCIQTKEVFAKLSVVHYNMGYCYLNMDQLEQAIIYFKNSLRFAEKTEAKSLQAFAYKGLADTYTNLGQNKIAIELFQKALKLSGNMGDLVLNIGIYKGLSDNYLLLKDYPQYHFFYKKYQNTKFEREQNGLKSINSSIESHTEEKIKQVKNIQKKYKTKVFGICSLGIFTILPLLYFIWKKRKKNRAFQKKIQKLI